MKSGLWMKSALWIVPVWMVAFGGLWISSKYQQHPLPFANLYVGIGTLGVTIANALMIMHKRIGELERKLAALEPTTTQKP